MIKIFSAKTVKAALFVGTLDILAACVQFYIKTNKGPAPIFKFIASSVFGKDAFTGGNSMILYGLLFHFLISLAFTAFFFWLCNKFPIFLNMKWITGIVYGILIWAVMNLLVLPISAVPKSSFNLADAVIGMLILIACMGIPLSLIAFNQLNAGRSQAASL